MSTSTGFKTIPSYTIIPNGKGHWMSTSDLVYTTVVRSMQMDITVPAYSKSNLASIPWFMRALVGVNGPHRIAAVLHDDIYLQMGHMQCYDDQGKEVVLTRKDADDIFLEIMLVTRRAYAKTFSSAVKSGLTKKDLIYFNSGKPCVNPVIAYGMWAGVRIFGSIMGYWGKLK